ncbi:MAG: helix-turn-helix transcriptional regulator [Clostridia bacterium]|nr:helix-turn-helix transcriptional regulator [Candidatus Methanomethylophilaceae archaeon]MBR4467681.1 helix-turn-helix transcriptional regulator [Clostridia bacterium]
MKTELTNASQLAEIVRRERKRQKVSQIRLSQLADVGTRFVRDLEDGKETVRFDKVLAVLETLGIAVELSSPGDDE